jgi:lysozyme
MTENQYITRLAIDKAREIIKESEGLRLNAYRCSAGKLTIGWGHLVKAGEPVQIDIKQAEKYLAADMSTAVNVVNDLLPVLPLNSNQQAALVSLVFNIGKRAFETSTLRRVLLGQEGGGKLEAIRAQWLRWVHADGKKISGLVYRREAEMDLFTCIKGL